MLKIKDNVDLKELEKFGFKKPRYNMNTGTMEYMYNIDVEEDLYIDITSKEIVSSVFEYDIGRRDWTSNHREVLFDLIEAGLVEKVSN